MFKYSITLIFFVFFSLTSAQAQNIFESGYSKVHLVEVFTSQGCNTCPQADRWMNSLQKNTGLWYDFVPVAFHVDYWDYLGWKDRFSKTEFSTRQRRYKAFNKAQSVYTPGPFLNGNEWREWFRDRTIPDSGENMNGNLKVIMNGISLEATYTYPDGVSSSERFSDYVLHVSVLGFDFNEDIKAGENAGKVIEYDFVVLSLNTFEFKAGRWFAPEFKIKNKEGYRLAVAAWLQDKQNMSVIQATGGYL